MRYYASGRAVLPAPAGMVPSTATTPAHPRGAPRTRGDGPATPNTSVGVTLCSLHPRGWSPLGRESSYQRRCSPHALVRMVSGSWPTSTSRPSAPRTEGDGRVTVGLRAAPRTRGDVVHHPEVAMAPPAPPAETTLTTRPVPARTLRPAGAKDAANHSLHSRSQPPLDRDRPAPSGTGPMPSSAELAGGVGGTIRQQISTHPMDLYFPFAVLTVANDATWLGSYG